MHALNNNRTVKLTAADILKIALPKYGREEALLADVFNPNESDLEYSQRRMKALHQAANEKQVR